MRRALICRLNNDKPLNIMERPPPYFPQSKLSPSDENRYKKFKLTIGIAIFALILILIGAGVGVFYLVRWAFA